MTSATLRLGDHQLDQASVDSIQGQLRHELQAVGLRPYEARVLLVLLQVEAADSAQLAVLSGVPRTSIYTAMASLTERGLAEILPTGGSMIWTCVGWPTVFDALDAAEEKRVDLHHHRTRSLRRAMQETFPGKRSVQAVR